MLGLQEGRPTVMGPVVHINTAHPHTRSLARPCASQSHLTSCPSRIQNSRCPSITTAAIALVRATSLRWPPLTDPPPARHPTNHDPREAPRFDISGPCSLSSNRRPTVVQPASNLTEASTPCLVNATSRRFTDTLIFQDCSRFLFGSCEAHVNWWPGLVPRRRWYVLWLL